MPNSNGGAFYCLRNAKRSVAQKERYGTLPAGDILFWMMIAPVHDWSGEYVGLCSPRFDWQTPGPIPAGARVVERIEEGSNP